MSFALLGCGSGNEDFKSHPGIVLQAENPLPPCPESPNCVRITVSHKDSLDATWKKVLDALDQMKPYEMELFPDENRIETVFLVVFFRDDMVVELEERENGTYVHIRSSSRTGYSDLGVNTKRVRRFLELIPVDT